jgi:hypothetical protein
VYLYGVKIHPGGGYPPRIVARNYCRKISGTYMSSKNGGAGASTPPSHLCASPYMDNTCTAV